MCVLASLLSPRIQGTGMCACRVVKRLHIPADVVERLWQLWQVSPYLCSISIPVVLTKGDSGMRIAKGLQTLGRRFQVEHLVGPAKKPGGAPRNASQKLHAVLGEQPLVRLLPVPSCRVTCPLEGEQACMQACRQVVLALLPLQLLLCLGQLRPHTDLPSVQHVQCNAV